MEQHFKIAFVNAPIPLKTKDRCRLHCKSFKALTIEKLESPPPMLFCPVIKYQKFELRERYRNLHNVVRGLITAYFFVWRNTYLFLRDIFLSKDWWKDSSKNWKCDFSENILLIKISFFRIEQNYRLRNKHMFNFNS